MDTLVSMLSWVTLQFNYRSSHMIFMSNNVQPKIQCQKGTGPHSLYLSPQHLNSGSSNHSLLRWPNHSLWEKTRNVVKLHSSVMAINKGTEREPSTYIVPTMLDLISTASSIRNTDVWCVQLRSDKKMFVLLQWCRHKEKGKANTTEDDTFPVTSSIQHTWCWHGSNKTNKVFNLGNLYLYSCHLISMIPQ